MEKRKRGENKGKEEREKGSKEKLLGRNRENCKWMHKGVKMAEKAIKQGFIGLRWIRRSVKCKMPR